MRLSRPVAALAAAALLAPAPCVTARSQTSHHPAKDAQPVAADANPLIATVNGEQIHLDDVRAAAQSLPDEARNMPPNQLFPMLVNQVIDQKALLIAARKSGLQKDPKVQKLMQAAEDTALQNVYLTRQISPAVTEDAVQDIYAKEVAGKPGETEIHARHILLATKAQAEDVIKQLNAGADFGKLAASLSTDKASAAQNGGDLGWFKQGDMLPEFSAAAFALKKGEISQTPVQTRYGFHVIQLLDTRTSTPPAFDAVKDQIRQQLIQQNVRRTVQTALTDVKVIRYRPDGSKIAATDQNAGAASGAPVPTQGGPATPGTTSSPE